MAFSGDHSYRMKALESELFQFRIGELATMTGASTRQLRYWESKGIISSLIREGEQEARIYNYTAYVTVASIKQFLDEGYTLKAAVKKTKEHQENWHVLHNVIRQSVQGVVSLDDEPAVDLGFFDEEETQRLYAQIDENKKVKYTVRPWHEDTTHAE
ncbi:MerR family transcriptional regulator [Weissella bombi]|uniref:DNA-binding transcriptional regulator, MerR family n=1 Tax=Weissella bombi TaxID=1505725 RepID=A0A1C3ZHB6_9LACO|nr:MerR family transcriptional regulator [Weissella bombi]SCB81741.1 DNA-binding transcriptional regulator, MerR family [Weissella bombi]